ncbi:MAG: tellurite resistance TerB family protein [Acetobacteraceae bacterium]|nr:tellurite resistance TerB family protein [Acetobacteraceae bacterium]
MVDALKLLGVLAENQPSSFAANRLGRTVQQEAAGGGVLQQILQQLGGPSVSARSQGGLESLLGSLTRSGGSSAAGDGFQGGLGSVLGAVVEMTKRAAASPPQQAGTNNNHGAGGLGGLAGALLGGGRSAVGGSLLAVLGSLAVSVLQNQAASGRPAAAGGGPGSAQASPGGLGGAMMAAALPQTEGDLQRRATLIVRAMVQAAKADGEIDQQEMQRITGAVEKHGYDDAARKFIIGEMQRPVDIIGLVRDVSTPEEAVEVYAASIMAIDVDTQAERDYLATLARRLNLPKPVVARVNTALNVPI